MAASGFPAKPFRPGPPDLAAVPSGPVAPLLGEILVASCGVAPSSRAS